MKKRLAIILSTVLLLTSCAKGTTQKKEVSSYETEEEEIILELIEDYDYHNYNQTVPLIEVIDENKQKNYIESSKLLLNTNDLFKESTVLYKVQGKYFSILNGERVHIQNFQAEYLIELNLNDYEEELKKFHYKSSEHNRTIIKGTDLLEVIGETKLGINLSYDELIKRIEEGIYPYYLPFELEIKPSNELTEETNELSNYNLRLNDQYDLFYYNTKLEQLLFHTENGYLVISSGTIIPFENINVEDLIKGSEILYNNIGISPDSKFMITESGTIIIVFDQSIDNRFSTMINKTQEGYSK